MQDDETLAETENGARYAYGTVTHNIRSYKAKARVLPAKSTSKKKTNE